MTEPVNKPDITEQLQREIREQLRRSFPEATDAQIDSALEDLQRINDVSVQKMRDERAGRAGHCSKCGHSWNDHDRELKGAGKMLLPEYNPNGYEDLYQCIHYAGMGDWCGCEERSRRPAIPEHLRH